MNDRLGNMSIFSKLKKKFSRKNSFDDEFETARQYTMLSVACSLVDLEYRRITMLKNISDVERKAKQEELLECYDFLYHAKAPIDER